MQQASQKQATAERLAGFLGLCLVSLLGGKTDMGVTFCDGLTIRYALLSALSARRTTSRVFSEVSSVCSIGRRLGDFLAV